MDDIVVMGSNTVDIYVTTDVDMVKISHPSHDDDTLLGYPLGDKILADDVHLSVGGSGVNAATALAKTGFDTSYLGCLGDDMFGAKVLDHLEDSNIAFHGSLGDQTGVGIILESQATDRTILSYKGCNNDLRTTDIPSDINPDWFYTSTVMGETRKTMTKLIQSSDKTTTAVNTSPYLAEKGVDELQPVLGSTDYLFVNKDEATKLTGFQSIPAIFDALKQVLRGTPLITAGGNGVYYEDNGSIKQLTSHDVDVVDTTGAGDAFNAGFLAGKAADMSKENAVKTGMLQSENVIQSSNTTDNLADKSTLLSALNNDMREPTVIR